MKRSVFTSARYLKGITSLRLLYINCMATVILTFQVLWISTNMLFTSSSSPPSSELTFLTSLGVGGIRQFFFWFTHTLKVSLCSSTFMREDILLDSSSWLSPGFYILSPKSLAMSKLKLKVAGWASAHKAHLAAALSEPLLSTSF